MIKSLFTRANFTAALVAVALLVGGCKDTAFEDSALRATNVDDLTAKDGNIYITVNPSIVFQGGTDCNENTTSPVSARQYGHGPGNLEIQRSADNGLNWETVAGVNNEVVITNGSIVSYEANVTEIGSTLYRAVLINQPARKETAGLILQVIPCIPQSCTRFLMATERNSSIFGNSYTGEAEFTLNTCGTMNTLKLQGGLTDGSSAGVITIMKSSMDVTSDFTTAINKNTITFTSKVPVDGEYIFSIAVTRPAKKARDGFMTGAWSAVGTDGNGNPVAKTDFVTVGPNGYTQRLTW